MSIDPAAFAFPGSQHYGYNTTGYASSSAGGAGGLSYSPPFAGGVDGAGDLRPGQGMRWNTDGGQESQEEGGSEDGDDVAPLPGEPNGRSKGKKSDKEIKRRSSKACDNCRKSKCKCTRPPGPDGTVPTSGPCQNCITTGVECTFNGASRKRGPPKGYIEAIESRLHRMEAMLGGLLQNDDPRAQALLSELIGDNEARDMLKKDLKAATEGFEGGKGRKSWRLPPLPEVEPKSKFGGRTGDPNGSGADFSTMRSGGTSGDQGDSDDEKASPEEGQLQLLTAPDDERQRPQRRRLNTDGTRGRDGASNESGNPLLRPRSKSGNTDTIPHTGTATYTLAGSEIPMSPPADTSSGSAQPISELADVVGQLSLDENEQVRYHGRSSGLYLISKSQRYKDFFWHFPKPGVWPQAQSRRPKTEAEILEITRAAEALPDRETMDHLLDLYWAFVHPVIPVLYKVEFLRSYRTMLVAPDIPGGLSSEGTTGGGGRISMLLLLVMFSLAARYSDRESKPDPGEYWSAGDKYMHMAKRILNQDYASSKLPTCQALILLAYREIGIGAMAESWLYTGMAIRMAQDMGLFRDVEKWFMPVAKFSYDVKQTRKRVWWAAVCLDKYVSTYIGRPMMIFERDYDTAFPSHDEPDEHEQWRALRPDGSDLSAEPRISAPSPLSDGSVDPDAPRPAYPTLKSHAISCFNCSASLSALISSIVANIYAIRIRVLAQSSENLLSVLDQKLANWYLDLPEHLKYSPSSKKVPLPHILTLHAQFYTALILLHRPFIPGQNAPAQPSSFPSHSICTTAANAIASISSVFSKTFGLRQSSPFMVYYIFTAAILQVYNSTFEAGMAVTARRNLLRCMNGLEEMESTWPGARRARELLIGLVDLRDVDLSNTTVSSPAGDDRGTKRSSDHVADQENLTAGPTEFHQLPTFHTRPSGSGTRRNTTTVGRPTDRSAAAQRRNRSTSNIKKGTQGSPVLPPELPNPTFGANLAPPPGPPTPAVNVPGFEAFASRAAPTSSTYDIFGLTPPSFAQNLPPGTSAAPTVHPSGPSFADMISTFLSTPAESRGPTPPHFGAAMESRGTGQSPMAFDFSMPGISGAGGPELATAFDTSAFFGLPLSADALNPDWQQYIPSAFFSPPGQGNVPSPAHDSGNSPGSIFGGVAGTGTGAT